MIPFFGRRRQRSSRSAAFRHNSAISVPAEVLEDRLLLSSAQTDLRISAAEVPDNSPGGFVVGRLEAVDADQNDSHSFSLLADADGRFSLNGNQLVVQSAAPLDFESNTSHDVRVRTVDGTGNAFEKTLTIDVTNGPERPTVTIGSSGSIAENAAPGTVVATVSVAEPDAGDAVSLSLIDSAGGRFALQGNQVVVAAGANLDFETARNPSILVRATDSTGLWHDAWRSFSLSNVNERPVDVGLSGLTVRDDAGNGTVVGDISIVDYDLNDTHSLSLVDNAGGRFAISGNRLVVQDAASIDHAANTTHDVTIRATDAGGLSYDKTLTIQVIAAQTSATVLNESHRGHSMPNSDYTAASNTVGWTQTGYESRSFFSFDVSGLETTGVVGVDLGFRRWNVTNAGSFPVTVYAWEVTTPHDVLHVSRGSDETGLKIWKDLGGGIYQYNLANGSALYSIFTVTADGDPDYNIPLYRNTAPEDSPAVSQLISAVNSGKQYFSVALANPATQFWVGIFEARLGTLTVKYDNTLPVVESIDPVSTSGPGIVDQVRIVLSEPVSGFGLSDLSLTRNGGANLLTSSESLTTTDGRHWTLGNIQSLTTMPGSYQLTLTADESGIVNGRGRALSESASANWQNQNTAPTGVFLSNSSVSESASGLYVGTLTVADPDALDRHTLTLVDNAGGRFRLSHSQYGTRLEAIAGQIDFEAAGSHQVVVRATDGVGNTFDKTLTVSVTNVAEPPRAISLDNTTVAENPSNGTAVANVSVSDPDGDFPGAAGLTLVDNGGGRFVLSGSQLVVADSTLFDYETATPLNVLLRATDNAGLTLDQSFTITVTNQNEAPAGISLSGNTVAERSVNGTMVGQLTVNDPDNLDLHTLLLTDSADGRFAVSDGRLVVADGSRLDHFVDPVHHVTVRATDSGGLAVEQTFEITVTWQNRAPTDITLSNSSVVAQSPEGAIVGQFSVVEPDRVDQHTWTLLDGASGRFLIDDQTRLVVASGSLLEAGQQHTVTVRVTDSGDLSFQKSFAIQVAARPTTYDYGDAPDSFGTTRGSALGAARHAFIPGFQLGAQIDSEADGQPGLQALGDDNNGSADEDGFTLDRKLVPGENALFAVSASAPGLLSAWIDFNQNGRFDADEQFLSDAAVQAGPNPFEILLPADTPLGETLVRFRFSSAGGLGPTGDAPDGEVEDHLVNIVQNGAPLLQPIADQTMSRNQDTVDVTVSASDPDSDPLNVSVRVLSGDLAYELDQQHNFDYRPEWDSSTQKWLFGRDGWYKILPTGELQYQDGRLLARLDASSFSDPSKLEDVPAPPGPPVTWQLKRNTLTIDPAAGFAGTFGVEVTASDGLSAVSETFHVTIENRAPTLDPIGDQQMSRRQDTLDVALVPSDPDNDPLSFDVEISSGGSLAYELDQQHNFDYRPEWDSDTQKWLFGRDGWYKILPGGELLFQDGRFLAQLDSSYFADPSQLEDVPAPPPANIGWQVNGSTLTLDPPESFAGTFVVNVTVSDGGETASQSFAVTIANRPPTLAPIDDQQMSRRQDTLDVALVPSDPDNDPLSFDVEISSGGSLAYELDQQHNFDYRPEWDSDTQKWLFGRDGWYKILPGGELLFQDGRFLAQLDSSYFADPSQLEDVPAPPPANIGWQVNGSTLTLDPPESFAGTFVVNVTVSDGGETASQSFAVTIANRPPTLAPIDDQQMSRRQDTLDVALAPSDPDSDPLTYTVDISAGGGQAYQLDQQHNFDYRPEWDSDTQKWLFGRDAWYKILPGGELLYQDGRFLAQLDSSYFADPSKLEDVPAPPPVNIGWQVNGTTLTLDPPDGFAGVFAVDVTVSDGAETATQSFTVTIANRPPTLAPIDDQQMSRRQDTLDVALAPNDPDNDPLTYTVDISAGGGQAYQLDQQHNFDYRPEWDSDTQKWLFGRDGWYKILPSGELLYQDGRFLAQLDSSFFADPSQLEDVPAPPPVNIGWQVNGTTLTLDPPDGFAGVLAVDVTVSDGAETATQSFSVTIANRPPTLAPIDDQQISRRQDTLDVALAPNDPDNDPLTYTVDISAGGGQAYQLDQQHNFDYRPEWDSDTQKWLFGRDGWYKVLPSGELLYQDGRFLAQLDSSFFANPSQLEDVPAPPPVNIGWQVNGITLTLDPPDGFAGVFAVDVTVSDGAETASQSFTVTVANRAPDLSSLSDQSMPHTQQTLTIDLPQQDVDGDLLTYSARFITVEQTAYELDQALGLQFTGSYSEGWGGAGEKWIHSEVNGDWYVITPDGRLFRWTGAPSGSEFLARSELIETLDASFHANPEKLWNAPVPPTSPSGPGGSSLLVRNAPVSGPPQLLITPGEAFLQASQIGTDFEGKLRVHVEASDGSVTDARTVTVTVHVDGTGDGAITGADGRVTLQINGQDASFEFINEATGRPMAGLNVAVGMDPRHPSRAVLAVADGLGQAPLQMLVLEGESNAASTAESSTQPASVETPQQIRVRSGSELVANTVFETLKTGLLPNPSTEPAPPVGHSMITAIKTAFDGLARSDLFLPPPLTGVLPQVIENPTLSIEDAQEKAHQDIINSVVKDGVGFLIPYTGLPSTPIAAMMVLNNTMSTAVQNAPLGLYQMLGATDVTLYKFRYGGIVMTVPVPHFPDDGPDASQLPPPQSVNITATGGSGTGGSFDLINKDILGVGIKGVLDTQGNGNTAVPLGNYELQTGQDGTLPTSQDVNFGTPGQTLTSTNPPPAVASIELRTSPDGVTEPFNPGTKVVVTAILRDGEGNVVAPSTLGDGVQPVFRIVNPVGGDVQVIDAVNVVRSQDGFTICLTIGPDQGAARIEASIEGVPGARTETPLLLSSSGFDGGTSPQILVNPLNLVVAEGQSASFTVELRGPNPSSDVTVNVFSNDETEGTLSTQRLTFNAGGGVVQTRTVTVQGVEDNQIDGDHTFGITVTAAASFDQTYNSINPPDVTVTVTDSAEAPQPGVIVTPTQGLRTTEDGGSASFTVRLASQPTEQVEILMISNQRDEGQVAQGNLFFNSSNWDQPQTVTVTGQDDTEADGDQPYQVIVSLRSNDPDYNGINPPDVSLVNEDNEDDVSRFDGRYLGSYSGTITFDDGSSFNDSGQVEFTVLNGQITVTAPTSGSGTVSESGDASFGASSGVVNTGDGVCTFQGLFIPGSASGTWTCSGSGVDSGFSYSYSGNGSWQATRQAQQILATGPAGELDEAAIVDDGSFDALVDESIARWQAAGLSDEGVKALRDVTVTVDDLPDSYLGLAFSNQIIIDTDASGYGWFVDVTPGQDEEFEWAADDELRSTSSNPAAGRVDLLSVLTHEFGHILGLDDLDADQHSHRLMSETLNPGVRRLPTTNGLDEIFGRYRDELFEAVDQQTAW